VVEDVGTTSHGRWSRPTADPAELRVRPQGQAPVGRRRGL
jgi:hypothetical protein